MFECPVSVVLCAALRRNERTGNKSPKGRDRRFSEIAVLRKYSTSVACVALGRSLRLILETGICVTCTRAERVGGRSGVARDRERRVYVETSMNVGHASLYNPAERHPACGLGTAVAEAVARSPGGLTGNDIKRWSTRTPSRPGRDKGYCKCSKSTTPWAREAAAS
eukprot:3334811-Prymnesium_polylepis.1